MVLMKVIFQDENTPIAEIQIDTNKASVSFLTGLGSENAKYDQLMMSDNGGHSLSSIWEQLKDLDVNQMKKIEMFNNDIKIFESTSSIHSVNYTTDFDNHGVIEMIIFLFEK